MPPTHQASPTEPYSSSAPATGSSGRREGPTHRGSAPLSLRSLPPCMGGREGRPRRGGMAGSRDRREWRRERLRPGIHRRVSVLAGCGKCDRYVSSAVWRDSRSRSRPAGNAACTVCVNFLPIELLICYNMISTAAQDVLPVVLIGAKDDSSWSGVLITMARTALRRADLSHDG